jgi:hypothetical protein
MSMIIKMHMINTWCISRPGGEGLMFLGIKRLNLGFLICWWRVNKFKKYCEAPL